MITVLFVGLFLTAYFQRELPEFRSMKLYAKAKNCWKKVREVVNELENENRIEMVTECG